MAITLVSHGNTGGNSGAPGSHTFTIPITCSAGDVIYVVAATGMGTGPTLTGETFSTIASLPSSSPIAQLFRCVATSAHSSSNISWSYTGAPIAYCAEAEVWTGVDNTSNVFGSINSGSSSGSAITVNCTVTTAAANSLTIGFSADSFPGGTTAGASYTQTDTGSSPGEQVFSEHANSTTSTSGTNVTVPFSFSGFGTLYGIAVSLSPGGASAPARRRANVLVIN